MIMIVLLWLVHFMAVVTFVLLCLLPVYTYLKPRFPFSKNIAGFLTCAYNATIGSICFLQLPNNLREPYCARVRRLQHGSGWRKHIADLNMNVITLFDPEGEHDRD